MNTLKVIRKLWSVLNNGIIIISSSSIFVIQGIKGMGMFFISTKRGIYHAHKSSFRCLHPSGKGLLVNEKSR